MITDCIIYMNSIYTHAACVCICKVCAFSGERARPRILRLMIDAVRGSRREAEDDDDKGTSKWKTREVDQLGPITNTRYAIYVYLYLYRSVKSMSFIYRRQPLCKTSKTKLAGFDLSNHQFTYIIIKNDR